MTKRLLITVLLLLSACGSTPGDSAGATLQLTSPGIVEGQPIALTYTCTGTNISPALSWNAISPATRSYALTFIDPDAPGGVWDHWVVYNLPGDATMLDHGMLPPGALQGLNSWGRSDYGSPCPPAGQIHHYTLTLYALDVVLNAQPGIARLQLESIMQGHIIAQASLTGTFGQ